MGSNSTEMVSVSSAAKLLGCKAGKVKSLCDHGLLRHMGEGNDLRIRRGDISELERLGIAGEVDPIDLKKQVMFLRRDVDRLQKAVDLLYEVNDMRASALSKLPDDQLGELYTTAASDAKDDAWPEQRVLSYCEVFIKLSEVEIDNLNEMFGIVDSWEVFYRLCLKMSKYVIGHPEFDTDLTWQRAADLLMLGRKNVRSLAVVFSHISNDKKSGTALLVQAASNEVDMVDDLAQQHIRKGGRRGHVSL